MLLAVGITTSGGDSGDGSGLASVANDKLDTAVEAMADRMASVSINQLAMQKIVINQAIKTTSLMQTQRLAALLNGITPNSPEGICVEAMGWNQAFRERNDGTYDWTKDRPINADK